MLAPLPTDAELEAPPVSVWERLRSARFVPTRRGTVAAAVAALVLLVLVGVYLGITLLRSEAPSIHAVPAAVSESSAPPTTQQIVAAVSGKVHHPGLVTLPAGSRVDDAIRAAGGTLDGTQLGDLNLARKVADGELIVVGGAGPTATVTASPSGASGGPLDLNLATLAQLDSLPGVGPVMAQRIVNYRTQHGRFESVNELRKVEGVGDSRFDRLKSLVTV